MQFSSFPMEHPAFCRPGESHFQSKGDVFPKVKVKGKVKIAAQEDPTELKAESEDFTSLRCIVMS